MVNTSIYIVGTRRFNNELLHQHMCMEKGVSCYQVDTLEDVLGHQQSITSERLIVLLDFDSIKNANRPKLHLAVNDHRFKNIPIAYYNLPVDSDLESQALEAGIRGFFYENDTIDSVCKGVKAILGGEIWITRQKMVHCLLNRKNNTPQKGHYNSSYDLTPREREILCLISKGYSNDRIATELFISPHTVKTHLYKSYKKIKVSDRLQAALWATDNLMPQHHAWNREN